MVNAPDSTSFSGSWKYDQKIGRSFGALANQLANWPSSRPDMTSFGAALNETATGPPLTPAEPGQAFGMPV